MRQQLVAASGRLDPLKAESIKASRLSNVIRKRYDVYEGTIPLSLGWCNIACGTDPLGRTVTQVRHVTRERDAPSFRFAILGSRPL